MKKSRIISSSPMRTIDETNYVKIYDTINPNGVLKIELCILKLWGDGLCEAEVKYSFLWQDNSERKVETHQLKKTKINSRYFNRLAIKFLTNE